MKCVVYAATRNLYQDMVICMKSLVEHTEVDRICCFIEDDRLPYPVPDFVRCVNVRNQPYIVKDSPNYNSEFTYIAMLRPLAYRYLDDDKVLSLDCDTIVRKDISGLFDIDISDHYFAAVKERSSEMKTVREYFNFGVAMLNMRKMEEIGELMTRLLNECGFRWPEQDLLNILCHGKILPLPAEYNACWHTGDFDEKNAAIRHYAGFDKNGFRLSEEYGRYLMTPWEEITGRKK